MEEAKPSCLQLSSRPPTTKVVTSLIIGSLAIAGVRGKGSISLGFALLVIPRKGAILIN